jgi:predicted DNA-binding transcriptional regulator YafY
VVAPLPTLPYLPALREAVAQRRVVELDYGGVRREVEPWGLLLRDGFWYLVGHDRVRGARRTFRVDRIEGEPLVQPGTHAFDRPPGLDLRSALAVDPKALGGAEQRDARVLVDAGRAGRVAREVGEERVVARHDDGSVELAVACTNLDAFRSWVLGLGEHAEVLEPPDVREHLIGWLASVAEAPS